MLRRIQNVSIYKNMDINLLKHIFEHVHILESQFQAGQTSEQTCPVRRSMRQPQGEDTTNWANHTHTYTLPFDRLKPHGVGKSTKSRRKLSFYG